MKRNLYVQLGRAGDILNILPLCQWEFNRTGLKPLLMVAKAFQPLLDGISYVEGVVWPGRFEDVVPATLRAQAVAEERGAEMVCTQIYGAGLYCQETCTSFLRESWGRVRDVPPWGTLPLEFDRRNAQFEVSVIDQLRRGSKRPYIVLALDGTSSPFGKAAEVRAVARALSDRFDVVDVSAYLAPRFFDLLGLFNLAHCIIAVDSGPLHLAAAVPHVPVIAYITRDPSRWHGSAWRPQQVARFYYDEPIDADLLEHIIRRPHGHRPTIWHAFTSRPMGSMDTETRRRHAFARETWQAEYLNGFWSAQELKECAIERDSGASPINDPQPVPFVRDLIDNAIWLASEDDIIAVTNADACFCPGLTGQIMDVVPRYGAAFTHRYDFYKPLTAPLRTESEVARGLWYPGSDAFFFTAGWWRRHKHEYPDMLCGREQCDEVLRQLIKRHGGLEIPKAIYHERHGSFWDRPENREQNPGNRHNRRLARQWFLRTGYAPNDPEWWRIPIA